MEFKQRRTRQLQEMGEGSGLFFAAPERVRNGSVLHSYRQSSDFFYLTGFEEPEAALLLCAHRESGDQVHLFLRERDPEREIWDGVRLGVEAAPERLGVDQAYPLHTLKEKLPALLEGASSLHYQFGDELERDREVLAAVKRSQLAERRGAQVIHQLHDLRGTLHRHRWQKSVEEQAAMRAAAALAARGHRRAMEIAEPGIYEYQLQAAMEQLWREAGSPRNAYPSIVGSGPMACILHYHENHRRCEEGELVLIDAGCELRGYASDITRSWPVNGRFSHAQRALYELALAAQEEALKLCRVGESLHSVHERTVEVLTQGFCDLGLLSESPSEAIETQSYRRYYMHKTSHWIGADVHDVGGSYEGGAPLAFREGVVLTVEPGIYVSPSDGLAPEAYRGIGLRIEDDVLVTAGAPEILSADAPKRPEELEALIGTRRGRG